MAVNVGTIAVALGRPFSSVTTEEADQWDMWIADALLLIAGRLGDPSLLDQPSVDYVVREAVKAMVLRPDDVTQVEVSIDDGRVSKTYRSGSGRVFILSEWWALLSADAGGAFTISPDCYARSW